MPQRSSCSRTSLLAAVGAERWGCGAERRGAAGEVSKREARAALQTGNRRRNHRGRAEGRQRKRRGARRSLLRVCLSASAVCAPVRGFPEAGCWCVCTVTVAAV